MKTKYISTKSPFASRLDQFPNAGPRPNITGMRAKYWRKDALIIKCGQYAYNVSSKPQFFENAK